MVQYTHYWPLETVMPWAGFEPARGCPRRILSPLCLPFHHQGILTGKYSTRREKKSN